MNEASIQVIPDHHDTTDPTIINRAKDIASGCVYRPALAEGEPVMASVRRRFYFDRPSFRR